MTGASALPMVARAKGVMIVDADGREYVDGCSGTICVNIGHGVPEVLEAISRQSQLVTFAHRSQFRSQPVEDLSAMVLSIAGPGYREVVYNNSGSETMETALRLALHHHAGTGRDIIVSQRPSYHGMTAGALAVSGHPPRRRNVDALLGGAARLEQVSSSHDAEILPSLEDWMSVLERVDPARVAAVVLEPVGGAASGGAETEVRTLRGIREFCDSAGALLIADEVMSGFGRLGEWFGVSKSGIMPDLLVTGKGLSGGYLPIGACIVGEHVLPGVPAAEVSMGHTMSGNPLAAAAALAVLTYTRDHRLVSRAREVGAYLRRELALIAQSVPLLRPPRGRGLLLGMGIEQDSVEFATTPLNRRIVDAALRNGLLVYPSGVDARTQSVMVCPPLTIRDREVEMLIARFTRAVSESFAAERV
ncbi:aminotransferase class III-fold pyridoxal phosphate-dependent enzyme [Micromonospora tarapacensis]|uniref:aminotransferase class III-fold pyridoxal phosphate-dependent enzyme n=1 Tax=Micromonospora tarapacensis TaxID=2835305 RepID=UPI002F427F4A